MHFQDGLERVSLKSRNFIHDGAGESQVLTCLPRPCPGLEEKTGRVVGQPGPGVVHISGRAVLDNHSVNFVSSLLTALLLPEITKSFF